MPAEFETADSLLQAYFADRGQQPPSTTALQLLRIFCSNGAVWRNNAERQACHETLDRASFDVEDLTENFLGIDLYIENLSEFDKRAEAPVFGIAQPASRTIKICERATHYQPLYRATVMHEVAHILMHDKSRARTLCYSPKSRRRPKEEFEADNFMSEAILPRSVMYLGVAMVAEQFQQATGEAFAAANTQRGRWQWRNRYFPFLVNSLCVSRELMAVKMKRLGFFSDETVDYHRSYRMATRWHTPTPGFGFDRILSELMEQLLE
jgi:hypothetical protein